MRLDPIVVVEHDPAWAAAFERERVRLEAALSGVLVQPIEHIGSTSIPGLGAKPIIDAPAVVGRIEDVDALGFEELVDDWVAAPEPGDVAGRRRSFCSPSVERRTHHLHVVEQASDGWRGWLAFRDHLRANPTVAAEYEALKRRLADAHGADADERQAYRDGKASFIQAVTRTALGD
ncbi:MAG TPA: GrpB family protein [Acidimicrobiales bacterium]|nr:GrpB family protein [Acidimicrobiales bacterium]